MNMKIFSPVYLSLVSYLLLDQQSGHVRLNEMRGSAISQLELPTSFRNTQSFHNIRVLTGAFTITLRIFYTMLSRCLKTVSRHKIGKMP